MVDDRTELQAHRLLPATPRGVGLYGGVPNSTPLARLQTLPNSGWHHGNHEGNHRPPSTRGLTMTVSDARQSATDSTDRSAGLEFGLQMVVGTRHYAQVGAIAEEAGFTSLHVQDHLVYRGRVPATYPYSEDGVPRLDCVELLSADLPCYDPFVQLGFLAASTQHVQLVTTVCIAPLYHPLALARSLATVDRMSGGRIALGLGVGWLAEEFAAVGATFGNRGRRADSIIKILRQLWTQDIIDYHDEFYRFGPIRFNPKPFGRA